MPNQRVERIFCPGRAKNPLTRNVRQIEMEAIRYWTDDAVRIGDKVTIQRFLRRNLTGVVTYVYDPEQFSPRFGSNDYGISIRLPNGSYLLYPGPQLPKNVKKT